MENMEIVKDMKLENFEGLSIIKNKNSDEKIVFIEKCEDIEKILTNNNLTKFVEECKTKQTNLYFKDTLRTTENLHNILKIILEFNKKANKEAKDYQFVSLELEKEFIDSAIENLELIKDNNIEENNLNILNKIIKLFEDNEYDINVYTESIINKISDFIISSFNDKIFNKINTKNKRDLIFNLKKSLNNIKGKIKDKFQKAIEKIENFIKNKLCENLPKKLIENEIIEILPEKSEIKINLNEISEYYESLSNENIKTMEELGFEFEIPEINDKNIVNALIIFMEITNFNNKTKEVKKNIGSLLNDENCQQKVEKYIEYLLKSKKNEKVTELVINLIDNFQEKGEEILLDLEKESRKEILKLLLNNNEKVSFNKPELQGEYEKVVQEIKLDAEIKKLEKKEKYCKDYNSEANIEKIKSIKSLFSLFKGLLDKDLIDCKKVKEILGDTFEKENNNNKFDVLSGKIKNLLSGVKKFRRARNILEKEEKRLKELANELSEYKGLYDRYRATSFFSRERRKLKKEMDEIYKNFKQKADFHQKYQRGRLHNFHHGILGRIATYKYMKSALKTVQKDLDRVKKGKVKISINALLEDNKDEKKVIDKKIYKFNKFVDTISKKKGITINSSIS